MSLEGWIRPTAEMTDMRHLGLVNPEPRACHESPLSWSCVPSLPRSLLADDLAGLHLLGPINSNWAI